MINKEIEEYKEVLYDLINDEDVYNSIKKAVTSIFEYIDQLENKVKELEKEKNKTNIKILSNAGIYQLGFNDGQKQYKRLVNNIKNKIEELDKEEKEIYKKDIGNNELYRLKIIDEIRSVLQKLLEEK